MGVEPIVVDIPADVDRVSILGEKLATSRLDGDALYTAPGRPVAVISQVVVEYKAAPPPPPPPREDGSAKAVPTRPSLLSNPQGTMHNGRQTGCD